MINNLKNNHTELIFLNKQELPDFKKKEIISLREAACEQQYLHQMP